MNMALQVSKVSDSFIQNLARDYLGYYTTMAGLAKPHNSSARTISNILYKGVVDGILDDATATAVAKKAICSTDNIVRTRDRWEKALAIREANILECDLVFYSQKLEELKFQLEAFDGCYFGETDAPTRENLEHEIANLTKDITWLENKINDLRG